MALGTALEPNYFAEISLEFVRSNVQIVCEAFLFQFSEARRLGAANGPGKPVDYELFKLLFTFFKIRPLFYVPCGHMARGGVLGYTGRCCSFNFHKMMLSSVP